LFIDKLVTLRDEQERQTKFDAFMEASWVPGLLDSCPAAKVRVVVH
jgi:hypothetical protein